MKIRHGRAELFHADGKTDGHDAFCSFVKAPKKESVVEVLWTSERQ